MSILRKIPKIEQVLDNMSLESLKRLESLMNSGNGATETYTLFGGENKLNYVNKDLGVWYCNIELERNKSVETGFLIWESETKALFISYDITQCLKEYEIDLTNYTYTKINEKLSIEEFRRVLEDNINKEVVHIDTTGNVEIGKNLVVDGKIILNGKEDLVDTSGNVLISGSSGGGDIWLDITPYLNEDMTSISQECFDLVWNSFSPDVENPSNKYVGILLAGIKMFYNELVTSDKTGFNFISNSFENGVKRSMSVIIYADKSIEIINRVISSSNKIWYDLYLTNGTITITQEQYNEIKELIDSKSLAGITSKRISDGYFSLIKSLNGTFTFRYLNLTNESNNNAERYTIFKHEIIIKPDLSVSSSSEEKYIPLLTQSLSNQSIISIKNDGLQQNLTVGDGLAIENGVLKTNIPALPSDANTKTYVLKAVNGVLTWVE